jgi:hypothetical protein
MVVEEMHFSDNPPTFTDLASKMGISRERVRQIHARSLRILKASIIKEWNKTHKNKIGYDQLSKRYVDFLKYSDYEKYDEYLKNKTDRENKQADRIINHFIYSE